MFSVIKVKRRDNMKYGMTRDMRNVVGVVDLGCHRFGLDWTFSCLVRLFLFFFFLTSTLAYRSAKSAWLI